MKTKHSYSIPEPTNADDIYEVNGSKVKVNQRWSYRAVQKSEHRSSVSGVRFLEHPVDML